MAGSIAKLVSDKDPTPNKFTVGMGELIRKAREEVGLTQAKLAERIFRRRATVSDMETGKVEVSTGTLALLASALDKPITYFFPTFILKELEPEKLSPLELELLFHFQKIWDEYLQKAAVDQVRILGEFNPEEMIWNILDIMASKKEQEIKIREYLEERKKRN